MPPGLLLRGVDGGGGDGPPGGGGDRWYGPCGCCCGCGWCWYCGWKYRPAGDS